MSAAVDTRSGVVVAGGGLGEVLAAQQRRVLATWSGLGADDWVAPTRNRAWTVHQTARHMADGLEMVLAGLVQEPPPFPVIDGFDPRRTPDEWLAASAGEGPRATIDRYARAAARLAGPLEEALRRGEGGEAATPYGMAHWTVVFAHVFWDGWIHERDIALPLGLRLVTGAGERHLAAAYALLMAGLPARGSEPFRTVVGCTGDAPVVVELEVSAERVLTTATPGEPAADVPQGPLEVVVDALSGRGSDVGDVLRGAPGSLGAFARFMQR